MFEFSLLAFALASTNGITADVRGEDIFPETTFAVAQAQNVEALLDRVGKSRMWQGLGDGESLEEWMQTLTDDMATEYDLKPDQVGLPAYLGLSAYVSFNSTLR